ncbi:hypothetical protein ACFSM5_19390 [Lacibacterium aquatile]|uniref:Transporter n=1 Tax=Lacibacterium aquatile TaxID=1168082 RepID=A0ABW5DVB8_9PROT
MRAALFAIAVGFVPLSASAGAWTQGEGTGQLITTLTWYRTDTTYSADGVRTGGSDYSRFELSPLLEYGATDSLTIGAQPRYQWLSHDRANGSSASSNGLADIDLSARQRIWRSDNSVLSLQGLVKLPGTSNDSRRPGIGSEQIDLEPRILFGHGFTVGSWSGFLNLEGAYRFRLQEPADEIRFDATLGLRPVPDWLLLVQQLNTIGVSNEHGGGSDYDVYKTQLSVVYDVSSAVSIQLGGYVEQGNRNIDPGHALFTALWWRF